MVRDLGDIAPLESVLEVALYVDDLAVAEAFYGGVLGFEKVIARPGVFVFFRCGGTIVLVFNPEETKKQPFAPPSLQIPGHGTSGAGHICFGATGEKLALWRARLIECDVAIEEEITWESGARSIYFRDPAGNSLEFAEPKLWGYGQERQSQ